jgi:hypothetical protein
MSHLKLSRMFTSERAAIPAHAARKTEEGFEVTHGTEAGATWPDHDAVGGLACP